MPELPEVETIKRELQKSLPGRTISGVEILWPKTVSPSSMAGFKKTIIGKKIITLDRRAKMLIVKLSSGDRLVFHLKMTGQLIFAPQKGQLIAGGHPTNDIQMPGRHTRLILTFTNGDRLYFNDLRKFGWVKILDEKLQKYLETEIGAEPLSPQYTMVYWKDTLKRHPRQTIKQVLLNQKLIAGIGNIYADEACFLSGILPTRKVSTLSEKQITDLRKNIIAVLQRSIRHKGTSSRNYRRSNGEQGNFVRHLFVYGRKGEECKKCRTVLRKIHHAGRGTHFCPNCQK